MDVDKFIPIGKELIDLKYGERRKVGEAYGILIDMQLLVDHAVSTWTNSNHN